MTRSEQGDRYKADEYDYEGISVSDNGKDMSGEELQDRLNQQHRDLDRAMTLLDRYLANDGSRGLYSAIALNDVRQEAETFLTEAGGDDDRR